MRETQVTVKRCKNKLLLVFGLVQPRLPDHNAKNYVGDQIKHLGRYRRSGPHASTGERDSDELRIHR